LVRACAWRDDPSVIKEAGKCVPAAEAIIDCLGRIVVPGERSGLTRPKSNRGGGNIRCVRSDPPTGPRPCFQVSAPENTSGCSNLKAAATSAEAGGSHGSVGELRGRGLGRW